MHIPAIVKQLNWDPSDPHTGLRYEWTRCHQECNQRPAPGRNGAHSSAHDRPEHHARKAAKRKRETRLAREDLKSGACTGAANASVRLTLREISERSVPPDGPNRPGCHQSVTSRFGADSPKRLPRGRDRPHRTKNPVRSLKAARNQVDANTLDMVRGLPRRRDLRQLLTTVSWQWPQVGLPYERPVPATMPCIYLWALARLGAHGIKGREKT